ncbi:M24 family metallopeptidase [Jiella sonneratiae]|uniref:Aminopeptidase P family protein n=1 Tax=Jiella sonneratiae TaxID=2816856 RepID=A0ABS3J3J6_9HYPH|nr:Xaa-Pro peptidase family protein [Jiella sonneratiae]MBO0904251.1 aminopeptidase P family protein [Jiella sonneratiae]
MTSPHTFVEGAAADAALSAAKLCASSSSAPAPEFAGRVARLRARMADSGVEIAILDEIEAISWISGYGTSLNRWRCVGIPLVGEPFYVIRALDAEPCREATWIRDVRTFRDWESPMVPLGEAIGDRGLGRATIGADFNSYCLSPSRLEEMRKHLPDARIVDTGAIVNELRLIKSPLEIGYLRRAASIADKTMADVAAVCVPGNSHRDVQRIAMSRYVELGGDACLPGPISSGKGWNFLHAAPSGEPLARGDTVHVELIPRFAGYSARLMRCVAIGPEKPGLARASETLALLQDEQIAAIRPGVPARQVDAVMRDGMLKSGLRDSYDNITGYTLGLYAPQVPRTSDFTRMLHPEADWVFEENMVFHIYASAGGASMSETVLVTAEAAERLTRFPRRLIVNSPGELDV